MNQEGALIELLGRVSAQNGAAILISDHELNGWPADAVTAMKESDLLAKCRPGTSAVCPGCERECIMPVHVLTNPGNDPRAFIVCDKRSDINRVPVPLGDLAQWQVSGESIAALLANLLDLHRSGTGDTDAARWEVGMFKGESHSGQLVLIADGNLTLSLANHSIPLAQVLTLDERGIRANRHTLLRAVDGDVQQPSAGIGSSVWRKQQAKAAADARHSKPGGSRDKQQQIRDIWATGKYSSRDRCAEEECAALDMSFSAARKALRNTPDPNPS